MTIQATNPVTLFPLPAPPADSPVAKHQPGEPITIKTLENGRFVGRMDAAVEQAIKMLDALGDGAKVKVVSTMVFEKQGFVINIGTGVQVKAGEVQKVEGRITATSRDGQLETFDDTTARQEKPKKGRKGKGAEAADPNPLSPDETILNDQGRSNLARLDQIAKDATSDEPPALEVETAHEEPGEVPSYVHPAESADEVPDTWGDQPREAADDQGAQGDDAADARPLFTLEEVAKDQGIIAAGMRRWIASTTAKLTMGDVPVGWERAEDDADGNPRLRRPLASEA
jgi:hypothetical protein